jgi:hypothetical protein
MKIITLIKCRKPYCYEWLLWAHPPKAFGVNLRQPDYEYFDKSFSAISGYKGKF